jgi:hypothetical protein
MALSLYNTLGRELQVFTSISDLRKILTQSTREPLVCERKVFILFLGFLRSLRSVAKIRITEVFRHALCQTLAITVYSPPMNRKRIHFFNTTGSCDPGWHYMLPPQERLVGA